jgi:hypothetical protein
MEPEAGSARWFETDPDAIRDDADMAVLMVRVGMASNALNAQFHAGSQVRKRTVAVRNRDGLSSLVTAAAVTFEAVRLARERMATLRPLALEAGASEELLSRVGKLCGGKHPAIKVLDRARNKLGFHWDVEEVARSVREYARNQKIVWLESDKDSHPVHRLALDVLIQALFPEARNESDRTKAQKAFSESMSAVQDAMNLITEFFTASVYGYMRHVNADRQEQLVRPVKPRPKQRKGGR